MIEDVTFSSSNEWGIPDLQRDMQAAMLPAPFTAWGSVARWKRMPGTYHFYVDDAKFSALWKHPKNLVDAACMAAVEPNFSTSEQMPLARCIWDVYRKRWMARYWQEMGVKVLVDLNVSEHASHINLIGVPKGWKAFATRYTSEGIEAIQRQVDAAESHTGARVSLTVYSGSKDVGRQCMERGWQWFPNHVTRTAADEANTARISSPYVSANRPVAIWGRGDNLGDLAQ